MKFTLLALMVLVVLAVVHSAPANDPNDNSPGSPAGSPRRGREQFLVGGNKDTSFEVGGVKQEHGRPGHGRG
ncbi:hypothetical protein RP20_CCG021050 [Aedes albopictus]|nr:hypothetical protein RP20_CCG021050 [Aedes albopictus]